MIFDLEADGLLPDVTKIHCIGIDDKPYRRIEEALEILEQAPLLVGHNIIGYDIPAIQKLYPGWEPRGVIRDTLVLTRLFWPHIKDDDFTNYDIPKGLRGSHTLKAWGIRLGEYKGENTDFTRWSQALQDYMMQDVKVTGILWERIEREAQKWDLPLLDLNPPPGKDAIQLEHDVAKIAHLVQQHGWAFDHAKALQLVAKLTKRQQELKEELHVLFPPITITTPFTPKANNSRYGYKKGVPTTKEKVVPFNPASRQQVGKRLVDLGWVPDSYTNDGHPELSDDILIELPYPEAKVLAEYFTVDKRLGQIANGKQAWFKHLTKAGRIHGRIHTGGAHTGRMTHSSPNIAQVPANGIPYGKECRECFTADPGWVLIGCDAEGLEQRCLAAYMAHWDNGSYRTDLLEGDKSKGTDGHSKNAIAIGSDRETAKTFLYALIYGAGDYKLGKTLGKGTAAGKKARAALMKSLPALARLTKAVKTRKRNRGYLTGLDGRRLFTRSDSAALNTLLQSAGAVIMKRALVLAYEALTEEGLQWGKDYAIVGLIHDEFQATARPSLAPAVGTRLKDAIIRAGEFYKFKCPLDAQYSIGANWSETH